MKILIVGGVAGGASAAARLRRLDESAEIVIFERTGYISYANCGLPYYVGGEITDREELTLQTPESFRSRFAADVRVRSEVTAVDPKSHTVTVRDLEQGRTYTESYDKLILAPGARPIRQDIPGADDPRVFTLRTVEDALALEAFVTERKPKRAVVAGGGYIGLEMTENLMKRGVAVTLVQRSGHLMKTLDYDMSCGVSAYLKKQGVAVVTGAPLARIDAEDGALSVTAGEHHIPADMVLLSLGVAPDTGLAAAAGLKLGLKGSIQVDEHMRTSDPDIYAVGDAVQIRNAVTGESAVIPLAGPANRQARLAADNICGIPSVYGGSTGASVFKLFDMTAASVGLTEAAAGAAGIPCESVVVLSSSHANYYPGAAAMTVKGVFGLRDGKLLGAQITGFGGVDKRIDVAASAVRCGMTASQLADLDLAYAPPYSSAKDPINVIGCVAENVLTGKVRQFHWTDVAAVLRDPAALLLDVRTDRETGRGMIGGAVHIPLDQLRGRVGELDRSKTIYVCCQSGLRSYLACRILSQLGFECRNLSGGYGFASAVMRETPPDEAAAFPCGVRPESRA